MEKGCRFTIAYRYRVDQLVSDIVFSRGSTAQKLMYRNAGKKKKKQTKKRNKTVSSTWLSPVQC